MSLSILTPIQSEEWPFSWFCEEMFHNLFNPAWEVRPLDIYVDRR